MVIFINYHYIKFITNVIINNVQRLESEYYNLLYKIIFPRAPVIII